MEFTTEMGLLAKLARELDAARHALFTARIAAIQASAAHAVPPARLGRFLARLGAAVGAKWDCADRPIQWRADVARGGLGAQYVHPGNGPITPERNTMSSTSHRAAQEQAR